MLQDVSHQVRRGRVALVLLVAAAAMFLPTLLGTSVDASVLSLVVVALLTAISCAVWCRRVTPERTSVLAQRRHDVSPVRRGRITDPAHHPLAPRAPGTA